MLFLVEGNSGSVYKTIHKPTNTLIALKIIGLDTTSSEVQKQIISELSILHRCKSPFIIRSDHIFAVLTPRQLMEPVSPPFTGVLSPPLTGVLSPPLTGVLSRPLLVYCLRPSIRLCSVSWIHSPCTIIANLNNSTTAMLQTDTEGIYSPRGVYLNTRTKL